MKQKQLESVRCGKGIANGSRIYEVRDFETQNLK